MAIDLNSDGYGRLVSAARTGEAAWTLLYNGIGDRVQVTAGPNVRRFVYDERGRLLGEYGTSAADVAAEHVWLDPDEGHEPLALIGATTIGWVHGDHLGTPAMLTDASGNIANSYQAWPFGQRAQQLAAPTTAMSFPGQVIDTLDRHYNRARDYDPTIGRYLEADPIGLRGGDNMYAYVDNGPINSFDPLGLFKVYGFWCGPDWTGGWRQSWNELSAFEQSIARAPVDPLDRACRRHDICYGGCRGTYPCAAGARGACFLSCDAILASQASAVGGVWGNTISRTMRRGGPRDPEPNSPKCPTCGPSR